MPVDKKKLNQTHYETLGLKPNCTEKEVKNAFVSLSKAHHPDLHPNDPRQQDKFVEIYEAYAVLSRPEKRLVYDSDLRYQEQVAQARKWSGNRSGFNVETDAPHYTEWRDESIWSMRDKTKENFDKNKPYYGIKGINRISNMWIAGGAIGIMMIGAFFHFFAFKKSAAFTVAQLDTRDERFARQLMNVRQRARRNGNDLQIELFKESFGWEEEATTDDK